MQKKMPHQSLTARPLALAVAACFLPLLAWANPQGQVVVSGSASFAQQGNTLTITNSPGAIIHWNDFSIKAGETTRFVQNSATSSVLNRVITPGNPSHLLGNLESNGRVYLINPAGILVGHGAMIDTAGFVASTLNLSNEDFVANRLNFSASPLAGKVENHGTIRTPSGGFVYLVGTSVDNHGLIQTPQGETQLAAGQTVHLFESTTPGVRVEVDAVGESVRNLGTIVAESGRIGLTAGLIQHSGSLSANSAVNEGGRIVLKATGETRIKGQARIEATGKQGGQVDILGRNVTLADQAEIDVSGQQGGGQLRIGGDYQGKNPDVQNAEFTRVAADVKLRADAIDQGDGGRIIVWADDTTWVAGNASARGGATSGNGGFVEFSGKRFLQVDGFADLRAANGATGFLLLDPGSVTISSDPSDAATGVVNNAWLGTQLGLADTEILTSSPLYSTNGSTETITVQDGIFWSSPNQLKLTAGDSIAINAAIDADSYGHLYLDAGPGGIAQSSAGDINVQNLAIRSKGDVELSIASGNSVTGNFAASIGDASNLDKNLAIKLTSGLNVGSVEDLSGINVHIGAGNYVPASNQGIVELKALGITQDPTATIGGRALVAVATNGTVLLNSANPVGIIAGSSSHPSASSFEFTSSNPIWLTRIGDATPVNQGIQATQVKLTSTTGGISQDTDIAYNPILTTAQLSLQAAGNIHLTRANAIADLNGIEAAGHDFHFHQAGTSLGVTKAITAGNIKIDASNATLTTSTNSASPLSMSGGNSEIYAANVQFNDAQAINTGSFGMEIFANTLSFDTNAGITGRSLNLATLSGGSLTCGSGSICYVANLNKINSTELQIGRDGTRTTPFSTQAIPATTSLHLTDAITRSGTGNALFLTATGAITQDSLADISVDVFGASSETAAVTLNNWDYYGYTGNQFNTILGSAATSFTLSSKNLLTVGSVTPYGESLPVRGIVAPVVDLRSNAGLRSQTADDGIIASTSINLSIDRSVGATSEIGTNSLPFHTKSPLLTVGSSSNVYLKNEGASNLQLSETSHHSYDVDIANDGDMSLFSSAVWGHTLISIETNGDLTVNNIKAGTLDLTASNSILINGNLVGTSLGNNGFSNIYLNSGPGGISNPRDLAFRHVAIL